MSRKSINKQLEELKKQAKQLEVAEKEFLERQAIEAEEKRKAEEEAKANIKPYKVFGRDFSVTDPDAMQFYKNRMKMMQIQYQLVGFVNNEGEYVIPEEIKYDLIEMKKAIDEMGDDYYKVTALYMRKHFNFTIKISMLDDGMARATLSIAEYVGGYVDGETIYTFVADFVDKYDADFRVKLRKAFNLYDVEVKNDDFNVPNLAVVMQDLYDLDQYIGGLYDISAQIYVMRMLKLLEDGGEHDKGVLERYRELFEEAQLEEIQEQKQSKLDKVKPNKLGKNEKMKELLDKAIDEKGGLEALTVDKKQLGNVLGEVNKTDNAIGNLKVGGIMEVTLPDAKPDNKGGSGGKSGGSSKKKAKKKEEKKKEEKKKEKKKDDKKKDDKGKGVEFSNSSNATEDLKNAVDNMKEEAKDVEIVVFDHLRPAKTTPARTIPEKPEEQKENPDLSGHRRKNASEHNLLDSLDSSFNAKEERKIASADEQKVEPVDGKENEDKELDNEFNSKYEEVIVNAQSTTKELEIQVSVETTIEYEIE